MPHFHGHGSLLIPQPIDVEVYNHSSVGSKKRQEALLGRKLGIVAVCVWFATANGRSNNDSNNNGNTVNLSAISHLKCGLLPIRRHCRGYLTLPPIERGVMKQRMGINGFQLEYVRRWQINAAVSKVQGKKYGRTAWRMQLFNYCSLTAFTVGLTLEKTWNYAECCCRISLTLDGKATHGKCFWNWIALGGPSGW